MGTNEEQIEGGGGKVQGGKGGEGAGGTARVSLGPLCWGKAKVQPQRPGRGRKSEVVRERSRC